MDDEQHEFENYYAYPAGRWPGDPAPDGVEARLDDRDGAGEPDDAQRRAAAGDQPRGILRALLRRLLRRT